MTEQKKNELIASIYATTLSPTGFNRLEQDLSNHVVALVAAITDRNDVSEWLPTAADLDPRISAHPDIDEHAEQAREIQSRLTHRESARRDLGAVLEAVPNPTCIFDDAERIVAMNSLIASGAANGSAAPPRYLSQVIGDPDALNQIRKELSALSRTGGTASVRVPTFHTAGGEMPGSTACVLVKQIRGTLGRDIAFLLSFTDLEINDAVRRAFRDSYELTEAEVAVAALLASGLDPREIAEQRKTSLNTVRTQIKSVKNKTGVRDLPQLVRLLCGYSVGLVMPAEFSDADYFGRVRTGLYTIREFRLADGRNLEFIVQGAPGGRPVLLLHNLPYGLRLPEAAVRHACAMGIEVIAPSRPGFGRSDPVEQTGQPLLDEVAADIDQLLTHLKAPRVTVVGNAGGSGYAVRFASKYPARVNRIVLVTRAPVWRSEWLSGLPIRQKTIALLLRYFPTLARAYMWAMISFVNRDDGGRFLRDALKDSESDQAALRNPETVALMTGEIRRGLENGPESMCRDWALMELDQTHEADRLSHPIHIIQGGDDKLALPEFSAEFVRCVPDATMEIVENAGNLLFYSHWKHVLRHF